MNIMVCSGSIKDPAGEFKLGAILSVTLAEASFKRYPIYIDTATGRQKIGDTRAVMRGLELWMFDADLTPAGHAWAKSKGGFYAAPAVLWDANTREIVDVVHFVLSGPVLLI